MAPVLSLAELSLIAGVLFFAYRRIKLHGVFWWAALAVATIIGGSVGVWFGFRFEYELSSHVIVRSFPVPAAFLVLEEYDDGTQQWIDFITPAPMLVSLANVFVFLGISAVLVLLAYWVVARVRRAPSNGTAP